MTLKELRKNNNLTQKEAALIVGVPYRTYLRYEENESYQGTYKYQKIYSDLENAVRIDENHGILSITKIKEILLPILRDNNIKYCYLFGSYARDEARENSDVDLLIDTDITGLDFFSLVETMRESLGKRVDVLRLSDLTSDNPIVIVILKEGIRLL